ncbi:hypothetical protein [uncultured Roseibium sp.]|uniref:hypothetical protein n=1 Tax=uncultured Roseibium sp. TaxID=1936171 RepID=UPI003217D01A
MPGPYLPPISTLLLLAVVAAGGTAAASLMEPKERSGISAVKTASAKTDTAPTDVASLWAGPRAETRREILQAPLFSEDRKLPEPFKVVHRTPTRPPAPVAQHQAVDSANAPPGANPPPQKKEAKSNAASKSLILPKLRLLGVLIRGDEARALLAETMEGAEEVWIERGEKIADWKLMIVSPGSVRLEARKKILILELNPDE